jgi:hypothetical protein
MTPPRYFILRLTRFGPLLPARLHEIDHEPGEPDNPRDRWPPTVLEADIAGERLPPEELTDRFFWPAAHWKHAEPVTEAVYRYHFERMRRAESSGESNPMLRPRQRVRAADVPLPNFDSERAWSGPVRAGMPR